MNFKMICTGGPYGDCCCSYDVESDEPCTVKDAVEFILSRGEWGSIRIDDRLYCNYRDDQISGYIPEKLRSTKALSIKAHGGWSLMDFAIATKKQKRRKLLYEKY